MREAAANLEFEEAARLRDEVKRLRAVELAVSADPLTRNLSRPGEGRGKGQPSRITAPEAHWPQAAPQKAGRSTAGKPGSRAGKGRRR
jgi:excinuclease ABC subunit B